MVGDFGNKSAQVRVSKGELKRFEEIALPHLDAAYNLARWLTGNEDDARDVVQDAYLRALQSFNTFRSGHDPRPWLLKIVRNTSYTWLRKNRPLMNAAVFDEETENDLTPAFESPESALLAEEDTLAVRHAIQAIAMEYREVLILREMEGLTYQVIAEMIGIPIGTVMSRLHRGRKELGQRLQRTTREAKR
jgi:RNA polymerase sigma-70 factor (ECF subfamily)